MGHTASSAHRPGLPEWTIALAWCATIVTFSASGVLAARVPGPLSALQLAIIVPPALFALLMRASQSARAYTASLDPVWLTGVQVLRVLGCSHLVTWRFGLMAGAFALPVGLCNLAVSMYALAILPSVAARETGWQRRVMTLSMVGLAEFAMTVGIAVAGFLAVATPLDPPMAANAYASVARLPISVFPGFLIPFFSILHVATIARVRVDDGS